MTSYDAVVIGGGFYGCKVALALRAAGAKRVALVEREPRLLRRASYVNQARVHNGYHYPRSLQTAISSRRHFARFCDEHHFAVHPSRSKLYAIARDSRISPDNFERFCREIGAPCRLLTRGRATLFEPNLITAVYEVEEFAFNADALAQDLAMRLKDLGVYVHLEAEARILGVKAGHVAVSISGEEVEAGYVLNCTYALLDEAGVNVRAEIKRELAEMALIAPPPELEGEGVTVMDGPFFSTMPFPAESCFSLSHVRYTPHAAWAKLPAGEIKIQKSSAVSMLRDASRYLPCMRKARYLRSIFDLKAVLMSMEHSDGRPILFERSAHSARIISILGSKIDNVYDIEDLIMKKDWAH